MAFGMTLGIGAGMPRTMPPKSRGTSLRPGREALSMSISSTRGGSTGVGAPHEGDIQGAIGHAMAGAEQARVASAKSGSSISNADNPYIAPQDRPGKLYGGTMGLAPDFTARDEAQRELQAHLDNPPGWLERAITGDESYVDKTRALQAKRDWAEKKAYEDAVAAYNANPENEQWEFVPDATTKEGVRIQRNQRGQVREAGIPRDVPALGLLGPGYDPNGPGATARMNEPVYDAEIARAMRPSKPAQHIATDPNGMPYIVTVDAGGKGTTSRPSGLEGFPTTTSVQSALAKARGDVQKEVKGTPSAGGAGAKGQMTPEDWVRFERQADADARKQANAEATAAFNQNFDYWSDEKREARAKELFDAAMARARTTAGGGGGGGDTLPPAAAQKIKSLPAGKKVKFGNGQVWINDNGTPKRVS